VRFAHLDLDLKSKYIISRKDQQMAYDGDNCTSKEPYIRKGMTHSKSSCLGKHGGGACLKSQNLGGKDRRMSSSSLDWTT
jgi:hypothetical protein